MICDIVQTCFKELLQNEDSVTCLQKSKCLHFCDSRKEAICTEKKKKYSLLNTPYSNQKLMSLHIDDGVITEDCHTKNGTVKCDYLFLLETSDKPIAILIELKGTDIRHAIDQIDNTLTLLQSFLTKENCQKIYGRIVHSVGVPAIKNRPEYMKLQRKLKRLSGNLADGSNVFIEKRIDLL